MATPYVHGFNLSRSTTGTNRSLGTLRITIRGMKKANAHICLAKVDQTSGARVTAYIAGAVVRPTSNSVQYLDFVGDSTSTVTLSNPSEITFVLEVEGKNADSLVAARAVAVVANTDPDWSYG